MKGRFGAGGKPAEARPRKTVPRKSPSARKRRHPSGGETEIARLTRELDEAREQQTATGDVLQVISRSTFDLQTVLSTLTESAARLCAADKGAIFQQDGDVLRMATNYGFSPEAEQYAAEHPAQPNRGSVTGRVVLEGKAIHIADVLADPEYAAFARGYQTVFGYRTYLGVPLLRDGTMIGSFSLTRDEMSPFTEKQIELATNFASQAVIAIENARLLTELRDSLQQQTATADVLKVISTSPGELAPVFDALLTNAIQVCEAKFGFMYLGSDMNLKLMAYKCDVKPYLEIVQKARFTPQTIVGRVADTKQVVQVADIAGTRRYADREPLAVAAVEIGGVRTILGVPLLKENEIKGAIFLYRQEVRPFTEKQIDLVKNFAAQAVIAIENTRLLNELRESLQQQTATSEVLQVISRSPGDLKPVFDTMLAKATQICAAKFGVLWLSQGEGFRCVALHNAPPAFADHYRAQPTIRPVPGTGLRRLFETREVTQVADMTTIQPYIERDPFVVRSVELGGYRSVVNVPMLKEKELIGAISIYNREVRPFTERQIELVTTFAAQAVIAIENARLLSELGESLQEQTATAEVLQVINGSSGDLEPVFAAMLEKQSTFARPNLEFFIVTTSPDLNRLPYRMPHQPTRTSSGRAVSFFHTLVTASTAYCARKQ